MTRVDWVNGGINHIWLVFSTGENEFCISSGKPSGWGKLKVGSFVFNGGRL